MRLCQCEFLNDMVFAKSVQVIVATVISFAANLSMRFNLPVIDDLGGILPGKWYYTLYNSCA